MAEWLKKHWKVVAAVAAGAVGLYLLFQRSQGAGAAAPAAASTDAGLPSTGPAPVDTGSGSGAPPQFLNAGEQAAAGLAQYQAQQAAGYSQPGLSIDQQTQQALAQGSAFLATNPLAGATATGVVSKGWRQVIDAGQTFWEDVSGKGRAPLSEQAAQLEGQRAKGEGPYYQSKGGTGIGGFVDKYVLPIFKNAAQDYVSQALPIQQAAPSTGSAASLYPGPQFVGPPAPQQTSGPQEASIASVHGHVPGPTTPHGIPNHAVGAH